MVVLVVVVVDVSLFSTIRVSTSSREGCGLVVVVVGVEGRGVDSEGHALCPAVVVVAP